MIKVFNRYLPLRIFIFAGFDAACLFTIIMVCLFAAAGWNTTTAKANLLVISTASLCLATMYFFDLYDLDQTRYKDDVIVAALRALGVGAIILAPISFLFLHFGVQVRYLEIGIVAFLVLVCLYRIGYDYLSSQLARGERILLIGEGPIVNLLAQCIREKRWLPLQIVAVIPNFYNTAKSTHKTIDHSELDSIINSFHPERIAIDSSSSTYATDAAHLIKLRQRGIRIDDAHALYEAMTARVPISVLQASNLACGPSFIFASWRAILYRGLDFIIAVTLLFFTWPIFLIVAVMIRLDSSGPIFYKQQRVGVNGSLFNVIKFRSMRTDAEVNSGPVWAQQGDSRVTRCGRVLRKLRLDELPQIWNVICGEMSLVGPRPERPHFVEMLRKEIPYYDLRHSVRPGITGWAQVCASYGASIAESQEKVEYDLFYLKNKSIAFDAFILFRTIKVCLLGKGSR